MNIGNPASLFSCGIVVLGIVPRIISITSPIQLIVRVRVIFSIDYIRAS